MYDPQSGEILREFETSQPCDVLMIQSITRNHGKDILIMSIMMEQW